MEIWFASHRISQAKLLDKYDKGKYRAILLYYSLKSENNLFRNLEQFVYSIFK